MLFEGSTYKAVRAAMAKAGVSAKLHDRSFQAYARSAEYAEYVAARRQFDGRAAASRLAARVMNDGQGPQSLADVAEYELLQQLMGMAGQVADPQAAAKVANAIGSLRRLQLARTKADLDSRLEAAGKASAEALAAKEAQIADLKAELEAIRNPPPEDASGLSDAEKTARIRERLGMV